MALSLQKKTFYVVDAIFTEMALVSTELVIVRLLTLLSSDTHSNISSFKIIINFIEFVLRIMRVVLSVCDRRRKNSKQCANTEDKWNESYQ